MATTNFSDITALYGDAYQADSIAEERRPSWEHIADVLVRRFAPATALDIGCGAGPLVAALAKRGVDAWGIEGSLAAASHAKVPIIPWDLRVPMSCLRTFDLVTCFDTAEHVEGGGAVAQLCVDAAKRWLVFGAATPDQGGLGHVFLQPWTYWHEVFGNLGFVLDTDTTVWVRNAIEANEIHNKIWWVLRNCHVYHRGTPP